MKCTKYLLYAPVLLCAYSEAAGARSLYHGVIQGYTLINSSTLCLSEGIEDHDPGTGTLARAFSSINNASASKSSDNLITVGTPEPICAGPVYETTFSMDQPGEVLYSVFLSERLHSLQSDAAAPPGTTVKLTHSSGSSLHIPLYHSNEVLPLFNPVAGRQPVMYAYHGTVVTEFIRANGGGEYRVSFLIPRQSAFSSPIDETRWILATVIENPAHPYRTINIELEGGWLEMIESKGHGLQWRHPAGIGLMSDHIHFDFSALNPSLLVSTGGQPRPDSPDPFTTLFPYVNLRVSSYLE